jgi:hypothetical protein
MKFNLVQLFSKSSTLLIASLLFLTAFTPNTLANDYEGEDSYNRASYPGRGYNRGQYRSNYPRNYGNRKYDVETTDTTRTITAPNGASYEVYRDYDNCQVSKTRTSPNGNSRSVSVQDNNCSQ